MVDLIKNSETTTAIIHNGNNDRKIYALTKSSKPFIWKILKDLALKNQENTTAIYDYIIIEQTEFNIKDSTKIGKIKALVYLSRFYN